MSKQLAFLGLGVMGFPMAGHLAAAGHRVTVFNRTRQKAEQWVAKHGGRAANTPAEAAQGAEIVMMCVGNDDDVRAVALGEDGALAGTQSGAIVGFLDAPVSGGQAGAENGKLTIMVGGDADVYARAESTLAHYARAVTLMGPAGAGQLTKMVNQICIAGLVQALSEGINFAQKANLDPERVLDVISKGAAQSWQMENRGKTMVADKFDFGFAVDWMRKDLAICLDEARRNKALLPVTAVVDQLYGKVQAKGGGRWDTSSLIRLLRD
jgi:3-hydroxyisobutyrate dehydrogenase-like beta-hydroxyacid dehydrogenase